MGVLHGWRLCPRCGGELDVTLAPARVSCPACTLVVYANPKPAVCALLVDESARVLLARRAVEPFAGYWDLPGGFVDEGEHPLAALRRELLEETGLEIEPGAFVGMWMDTYGDAADAQSTLNLYWEARIVSGTMKPADDVSELRWFEPGALPPRDQLAFATFAEALAAWAATRGGP
jgi:ADP-ribose pyrophosphatase YjhB (NUDIX family)